MSNSNKRNQSKEICFQENKILIEKGLPLEIVLYPGFYGAFFGFKEDIDSENIYYCSCMKESIENYLLYANKGKAEKLDSNFPLQFRESKNPILNFKDKICHECNLKTPSLRYCHEMYGSTFKQNYGWYIQKKAFEWGVFPHKFEDNLCPDELLSLLTLREDYFWKKCEEFKEKGKFEDLFELQSNYNKEQRKIWNIIENEVRLRFGHKKIGDCWTSETILYYIIRNIYGDNMEILRHYRPKILEGLELDIYIEDLKIGIEYQGIQHYKAVKHWGGEKSLIKMQERDARKKELCKLHGINLIYFEYYEGLSEDFVRNKISNITAQEALIEV